MAVFTVLFTGLAVASAMSQGRSWVEPLIAPAVCVLVVWLILRARGVKRSR
ncbi:MAG: hypothetical protein QM619_02295 [Micropruina sp.]|uniref:hypothetical protein n=1 Tax=Micropruina sp. TaxID=2737536 RepID=UPI0039E2B636